jgi:hypothetical protein
MKMGKSASPVEQVSTSINIDRDLWRGFKAQCAVTGTTVTEQLETLIKNFLSVHKVRIVRQSQRTS